MVLARLGGEPPGRTAPYPLGRLGSIRRPLNPIRLTESPNDGKADEVFTEHGGSGRLGSTTVRFARPPRRPSTLSVARGGDRLEHGSET